MKLANIAKLAIAGVGLSTLALSNSVFAEIHAILNAPRLLDLVLGQIQLAYSKVSLVLVMD
jgi:hypothetical protein